MSAEFKILPELRVVAAGGIASIQTGKGSVLADGNVEACERLVECWNALRSVRSPTSHIAHVRALDEAVEQLKQDLFAAVGAGVWSLDFDAAPRDRQIIVRTTGDQGRAFMTRWLEPSKRRPDGSAVNPNRMDPRGRWDGFPTEAKTLLAWCELPVFIQ